MSSSLIEKVNAEELELKETALEVLNAEISNGSKDILAEKSWTALKEVKSSSKSEFEPLKDQNGERGEGHGENSSSGHENFSPSSKDLNPEKRSESYERREEEKKSNPSQSDVNSQIPSGGKIAFFSIGVFFLLFFFL